MSDTSEGYFIELVLPPGLDQIRFLKKKTQYMSYLKIVIFQYLTFTFVLITSLAFSHGTDKPGPNGGLIQMPGSFHTEIVQNKNNSLELFIYLLDMNFKNPTTDKSFLEAKILLKDNSVKQLVCKAMEKNQLFSCLLPKDQNFDQIKEIIMRANRQGQKSTGEIKYSWPLEIKKTN